MNQRRRPDRESVFVIELQPVRPGPNDIHALRAILKTLLRRFGWRCTAAREEPTTHPPKEEFGNDA
jgi:hypothetical protein